MVRRCEADDIIHSLAQLHKGKLTVVSTDGDLQQLLNEQVSIFHPQTRQFLTASRRKNYELFEKCMRGDRVDNIPAAYPRVKSHSLQRAFFDTRQLEQLLDIKLANGKVVRDNYLRNKQLIDLSEAPEDIKNMILDAIRANGLINAG